MKNGKDDNKEIKRTKPNTITRKQRRRTEAERRGEEDRVGEYVKTNEKQQINIGKTRKKEINK